MFYCELQGETRIVGSVVPHYNSARCIGSTAWRVDADRSTCIRLTTGQIMQMKPGSEKTSFLVRSLLLVALALTTGGIALVDVASQDADENEYLGVDICKQCHEAEYEAWKSTPHARALRIIHWTDETGDKQCLPCHTTGYGNPGGFTLPSDTPELANVQCEACHGPGRGHIDGMGAKDKITRVPRASTCTACHMRRNVH